MIDVLRSATSRARLLVADQAALDVITKAAEQHQKSLGRLERAVKAGKPAKVKKCIRKILRSADSTLSALVRTISYDADAEPYSLPELLRRTRALNPFVPLDESVRVQLKEKPSGDWRPVVSFGWRRRALQQLFADILKVCLTAYPFDFMEKGNGGADGAAQRLGAIIKEGQYDFVLTVDFANCFGSVQKEGVAALLPLPHSVVRNVLLIEDDVEIVVEPPTKDGKQLISCPLLLAHLVHEADTAARLGIPQGSSVSNLVMSRNVLGPVLSATTFADRTVLYGDDIAVAVKSEEEAELIYQTLRSLFENIGPVGPLTIGFHRTWRVDEYVNFCKFKLKRTPEAFGGEIRFSPSTRSLQRYDQNVERIYLDAPEGAEEELVGEYTTAWKKAYCPLWQPNEVAEDMIAMATNLAVSRAWMKKYGEHTAVSA